MELQGGQVILELRVSFAVSMSRFFGHLVPPLRVLAAGSESSAATSITPAFAGGIDGPVMFAAGPLEDGEDALIEGVLVRGGDLPLRRRPPLARGTVLWRPFGTAWDDDAKEVIAPDGTRIRVLTLSSATAQLGF
jgi:hypothetical protein